eukprot:CAMPEP_0114606940 /NCGR_PEP_ID=MMETSP0168-20121206/1818_1 /TAXON_ID=95228 ORGANISM="Vannella sp., Strain DIVA3 517/6/12" /NCGR_SAMPLE_ID=MMETSP0168 /ASSEMBLY_ACC=CAM_ASM_000044 /LENGTH=35 /DNA_ID= /DNA_START= /DNA_END= /DNA_ORIENTATION=
MTKQPNRKMVQPHEILAPEAVSMRGCCEEVDKRLY